MATHFWSLLVHWLDPVPSIEYVKMTIRYDQHTAEPDESEPLPASPVSVSVVIPTFNRCDDCKCAVVSALEQQPPPLEVLVCDDGSTDDTRAEFERWQMEEPRLRYLRMERNRGTPAPARNLGTASARGDWVAFLDDDDRWLPGKLARQMPLLAANDADIVATDAIRSDGRRYFVTGVGQSRPSRADIERANPIILSSAIIRRSLFLSVQGFDESRKIAGVEDYDLWLRLADRGARFAILDATTVDYRDQGSARLSSSSLKTHRTMARVRLRRLLRAPTDPLVLAAVPREIYAIVSLLARSR